MADATTSSPRPATGGIPTLLAVPGRTLGLGAGAAGALYATARSTSGGSIKGASADPGSAPEGKGSPALRRVEALLDRLSDLTGAVEASVPGHQRQR